MMKNTLIQRRHFLLLAGAGALAACADKGGAAPTFAPIRFKSMSAFRLNVEKIEIENRYQSPGRLPHVDHAMQNSPSAVMSAWAQDRLEAGGQPGGPIARFIITDAKVIETELATKSGIKGVFSTDQAFKYDARIAIELSVRNERGMTDATVNVESLAMRTIKEDATDVERETLWNDMIQGMARDINAQMEKNIPQGLGKYLQF
ncbi:hypothetical protein ACFSM5_12300 [Lacibacterium aquatile]|uniref:Lipoprotein n=1 Tax=Lacibacterium aquatile TaxID=1168082 RepID=A0ABW5DRI6_9PROT